MTTAAPPTPHRLRTYNHKLVILGESSVGKSSIILQYINHSFTNNMESTIGAAYTSTNIELQNCIIRLEIWDTAGQERYAALAPMYFRGSSIALIIYDITVEHTFQRAQYWVNELRAQSNNSSIIIALCGNKLDLLTNNTKKRAVPFDAAKQYAVDNNLLFFELSAKTSHNINELFYTVANKVASIPVTQPSKHNNLTLSNNKSATDNTSGCCG